MSYLTGITEEIIETGADIKNLRLELAPLQARVTELESLLEQETRRLEALVLEGRSPAQAQSQAVAPQKRKNRTFAGRGFIRTLLDFMQSHPNQQVTPEGVALALGEPKKSGLAATCLKRLFDAGMIERPRTGHYVFRELATYLPPKQPAKEPAMSMS